jgi:hypothetical protein
MEGGRGVLLSQQRGGIYSEKFASTLDLIIENLILLFTFCIHNHSHLY